MRTDETTASTAHAAPRARLQEVAIHLHPRDNVAIAKADLEAGMEIHRGGSRGEESPIRVRRPIPSGHKLALEAIEAGDTIWRYGQVIGRASRAIPRGEHVHIHNVELGDAEQQAAATSGPARRAASGQWAGRTFLGYQRPEGRVGTRNYVVVLATVNCSGHVAQRIARHFGPAELGAYPNVDGVIALTHSLGCPMQYPLLQRTLAGMAAHPNVGAYILVGLGCETNQAERLMRTYDLGDRPGTALVIQDLGGIAPTVAAGIAAVQELLPTVNAIQRSEQPISALTLALQCGGSDSWSGVTANPVLGLVADELVREGGTVVLAETPEIYGAEHLLAQRAARPEVRKKLLEQVEWWKGYAGRMGIALDDNRSVGNTAGGLTTIYEKSLGAVAKAGSSPLVAVYGYAETVSSPGFCFMNSPGYDPVAVTGQVAGGCNVVAFTTGRGSVFGSAAAPCIKISSTTATFQHMRGDMDLNAGRVLEGQLLEVVAGDLFALMLEVASGRRPKSEAQGVGEVEFCPWNVEGTL